MNKKEKLTEKLGKIRQFWNDYEIKKEAENKNNDMKKDKKINEDGTSEIVMNENNKFDFDIDVGTKTL